MLAANEIFTVSAPGVCADWAAEFSDAVETAGSLCADEIAGLATSDERLLLMDVSTGTPRIVCSCYRRGSRIHE